MPQNVKQQFKKYKKNSNLKQNEKIMLPCKKRLHQLHFIDEAKKKNNKQTRFEL